MKTRLQLVSREHLAAVCKETFDPVTKRLFRKYCKRFLDRRLAIVGNDEFEAKKRQLMHGKEILADNGKFRA